VSAALRGHRALLLILVGLLAGCATVQTTRPGAIGVARRQQMMVSEEAVAGGAAKAYAAQLEAARQGGKLNADPALLARVRQVAGRLIPQTSVFRPEAPGWAWEINLQTTDDLNAYCMPGGKIMVYSGLVLKLDLSDAELAAVIGHEMAHALREHTRERVSRAYAQSLVLAGVAALAGLGPGAVDVAARVSDVTFGLPHSRGQEEEADVIGLELMARAGYDPRAAVEVWRKMAAIEKSAPPQFLSTHPASGSRIADLQQRIPTVAPLYEAARR
jgi:predicted Zn-dependent protease